MEVPVLDAEGKEQEKMSIDEGQLGGRVHKRLLRDAVIMYEANRRQGTAKAKSRGETHYGKKKPYRQKGTGYARAGFRGSPPWRGGGAAHGPRPRDYSYAIPKRARQVAMRSALLGRLEDGQVILVDRIEMSEPKTKTMARLLRAVGVTGSCLVVIPEPNAMVWKSARNIAGVEVCPASDLNAYVILKPRCLVVTKDAMNKILGTTEHVGA
ncbi:MAG: 50S ribosomal protein L4 [Planctomycetes bacterium]|nr:50S ribosomal protein L4 [Planctomycetota bacterium]